MGDEVKVAAAILSFIRGEVSAACVAERFGVAEQRVNEWADLFIVAGIVELTRAVHRPPEIAMHEVGFSEGDPTTPPPLSPPRSQQAPKKSGGHKAKK